MIINNSSQIGKKLNKEWAYNIFQEIESSSVPYLSSDAIVCLKKYRRKNRTLDDIKNIWKSLLIDAISILKINDSREKIYDELSKGEILTRQKFDKIRKISSYGIDELRSYLDDFIDFESVLYGTEKHYRNHVDHVFQVWAAGILLLDKGIQLNDGYNIDIDSDFHFSIDQNKDNKISKSELWAMWIIIALCHDLGYPIEKSSKINKQTKKIISHFGSIQFTELEYNFNILNTFLIDKFLDITSSKVYRDNNKECGCTTFIQSKYRDKLSKSLEDYKHGVFSSLLLFKSLTYFLETDYFVGNEKLEPEDARQFYIRKEILRSIAGHTCPKMYHLELNTPAFLLILCDELQEWNRPNFESLVTGNVKKEPGIKILKCLFDNKEQTIHIEMKYEIEDPAPSYEEYLIRNKFKNIHYLLRSAVNDLKRKVLFCWDIYVNKNKYQFIFNSNENSFEQLKVNKIEEKGLEKTFDIYI